jgi:hypothetical protein
MHIDDYTLILSSVRLLDTYALQELYARCVYAFISNTFTVYVFSYLILLFYQPSRCQEGRKLEVSRGIVHAVKNFQGRFLELDKTTGSYYDIGEEKAIKKTSQALRDGQSKIKQLFQSKSEGDAMTHTPEEYFAYSVKVLSALYAADSNPDLEVHTMMPPLPTPKKSRNKREPSPPRPSAKKSVNNGALNMAVQNALEQFPMVSQSIKRNCEGARVGNYMSKPPQLPRGAFPDTRSQYSDMSMSMASLSTISDIHTISSGQSSKASIPKGNRGSFDTFITTQSHQKMFEKEKHCYELDFIDEATTCYDDTTEMDTSFSSPPGEGAAKESTCSNYSLMNQSVSDFSMGSETVKHFIGMSAEKMFEPSCTSVEI